MSQLPVRDSGESGAPSAQTHMRFDDNTLLAMLFGEHDRHIAQIENACGVMIGSRGNELEISDAAASRVSVTQAVGSILTSISSRAKSAAASLSATTMAMMSPT